MSQSKLSVLCPQCGATMSYRSQSYKGSGTHKYTVKKYECEICGQIDYLNAKGFFDIGNNKDFNNHSNNQPKKTNSFDDDISSHIN